MEAKALANKEAQAKREHEVKMLELKKLAEQEKREFQAQAEAQAQAKALEAQAIADELKREFEAKLLAQTQAHELALKQLEVQSQAPKDSKDTSEASSDKFDVARQVRLVPIFQEKDVDKYFAMFEKVATSLEWPKDVWTMLFQSAIKGKAQEVYSALSLEDSSNYEKVKDTILKAC